MSQEEPSQNVKAISPGKRHPGHESLLSRYPHPPHLFVALLHPRTHLDNTLRPNLQPSPQIHGDDAECSVPWGL